MKAQLVLQCMLVLMAVGGVASFGWVGIVFGAVEGLAKGVLKGSIGAFSPLAQEGLSSMRDFFGGLGGAADSGLGSIGSIAEQGMGGLGSLMNGFGGLGGIFNQIFSSWGSILTQLFSGGGDLFGTLFNVFKSIIEQFFSILGSLTGSSRLQVNGMVANTGNVFTSVMKLKLNPDKNKAKLTKEILAVQKIVETPHKSPADMLKAVKSKAPALSAAFSEAYVHARAEFQKHMKVMHPEAKKGVQKMQIHARQAKLDLGGILGTIMNSMGGITGIFQTGMSILQNLFGAVSMLI